MVESYPPVMMLLKCLVCIYSVDSIDKLKYLLPSLRQELKDERKDADLILCVHRPCWNHLSVSPNCRQTYESVIRMWVEGDADAVTLQILSDMSLKSMGDSAQRSLSSSVAYPPMMCCLQTNFVTSTTSLLVGRRKRFTYFPLPSTSLSLIFWK